MNGTKLTEKEKRVLNDLRNEIEQEIGCWGVVYLDNCRARNEAYWAGVLGSLEKKGLYRPYQEDGFEGLFGDVKLNQ